MSSLSESVAIARQCSPGIRKPAVLSRQLLDERGLATGFDCNTPNLSTLKE
ncbi:hypothetical protein A2U01_0107775 [Trifolium medium]|uniref:Uncharacterized protein n=1 Tax=Trifolium medium TaxID=97028 RepID=A0A392VDN0_9FABA|nr:hypothetical protein [Trifolium medium]